MESESIANGSVPAFLKDSSKDLGKKKRANNRLARLKQCKLDARREQWLSQVKNKGIKGESIGRGVLHPSSSRSICERKIRSLDSLEMGSREDEKEELSVHVRVLESQMNSRDQESRKDRSESSNSSSSSSSSSSSRSSSSSSSSSSSWCCSGNVSDEEEEDDDDENNGGDDGCVDDWEAVADALTAGDKRHQLSSGHSSETEAKLVADTAPSQLGNKENELGVSEMDHIGNKDSSVVTKGRAWRPDDAFRPQCLPNLSKQYSFPMNGERHCEQRTVTWACHSIISQPSPCPICYEDLDPTDYSFLPCLCGFRLCLFCYKRILEADERCPGCRKHYDTQMAGNGGGQAYRLTRSCSMSTRF